MMMRPLPRRITLAAAAIALIAADPAGLTLFDGKDAAHWKTNTGKPLPMSNVQGDGINPHGSGGYIVIYDRPFHNFTLDFDYKISKGCNSGVFLRVGDPKDPVNTGLEVAIDDARGVGLHDPGAFYDLAAPKANAQKPAGEWNHMTITAQGPRLGLVLNGEAVNAIDLSQFAQPGRRPDGSKHKFGNATIATFDRPGYLGFQDHGQDCWFKNVTIRET